MAEGSLQQALRAAGLAPAIPFVAKKPTPRSQPKVYRYRGLPCSIASDADLWMISGVDANGGSGVLEWCPDEAYASARLELMREYPQFSQLVAEPFVNASWGTTPGDGGPKLHSVP